MVLRAAELLDEISVNPGITYAELIQNNNKNAVNVLLGRLRNEGYVEMCGWGAEATYKVTDIPYEGFETTSRKRSEPVDVNPVEHTEDPIIHYDYLYPNGTDENTLKREHTDIYIQLKRRGVLDKVCVERREEPEEEQEKDTRLKIDVTKYISEELAKKLGYDIEE